MARHMRGNILALALLMLVLLAAACRTGAEDETAGPAGTEA